MPKLSQVVPNIARATLRAVAPAIAERSMGPAFPNFQTEVLIKQLIIPISQADPDTDAAIGITDECLAFVKDHAWADLANYLTEIDQSRSAVPSGKRMCEVLLHFLRDSLSEMFEAPNELNYETSFVYSRNLLDAVEAAYLQQPKNYMLAAILARFHLDCAWSMRRTKTQTDIDPLTRSVMFQHCKIISDLITRFDPIAYNSPLLAEIQYSYAALIDPDLNRLMCAFDDWMELDPANMTAYRHHAFFIHNLHSSKDTTLIESEARRAITLGEDVIGDAAYTVMYLHALQFDAKNYALLDPDVFTNGFDDLMQALNKDPMRLNYLIEQVVERFPDDNTKPSVVMSRTARAKSVKIRLALAPIIRKYLGLMYAAAWDLEETDFLHAVAPSFAEELERGATIELSEVGAVITEGSPTS